MIRFVQRRKWIVPFLVIVLVLVILIPLWMYPKEPFVADNPMPKPTLETVSAEGQTVYGSLQELIDANPGIKTDKNTIVHLVNGGSGFGSQITLIAQNMYYLKSLNPDLVVLPSFEKNGNNFKYAESGIANSFFLYYRLITPLPREYSSYQRYYVKNDVLKEVPFIEWVVPIMKSNTNRSYIKNFNQFFEANINHSVSTTIQSLSRPLIGIHIRSLAQKQVHKPEYLDIPLDDRLRSIASALPDNTSVFVMTDVDDYLTRAKQIFNRPIYFIENVERVPTGDMDSIPSLGASGYKLGVDILNECYAMSLCDKIYVSEISNISFIIAMMNPEIEMVEY